MDNKQFGNFIKEMRKKNNLTQRQLAEKLHLTDKAVSKWERGLSYPDISVLEPLAEVLGVSVQALITGKANDSNSDEFNREDAIKKMMDYIEADKEARRKAREENKLRIGLLLASLFFILLILHIVSYFLSTHFNYQYVFDWIPYVINAVIILLGLSAYFLVFKRITAKRKVLNYIICFVFAALFIINAAFMINNGFNCKYTLSCSPNFSNCFVIKQEKKNSTTERFDVKFIIFAREYELITPSPEGQINTKWLTNDICAVTYSGQNDDVNAYVATYGERGSGTSYINVTNSLYGSWQQENDKSGSPVTMTVDINGITVCAENEEKLFSFEDIKQYGTTAVVLFENKIPRYILSLNEDCTIDEKTELLNKGSTVTLAGVDLKDSEIHTLYCSTYKSEDSLDNYKIVDLDAGEYQMVNSVLYFSYDGEKTLAVQSDLPFSTTSITSYNCQISQMKTVFVSTNSLQSTLVYSDDGGKTWNTKELEYGKTVQNIHFLSKDVGYMLTFSDAAMSSAYGEISKTTDGGVTWKTISNGIETPQGFEFKTGSQIYFPEDGIGFLTFPQGSGESCDLYFTTDDCKSFKKLTVKDTADYDYYELPFKSENDKYVLRITRGSDGDCTDDCINYISDEPTGPWSVTN